MDENAYAAYRQSITLFLEARGQATAGLLSYHINRPQAEIEQCIAAMVERGQVEQCGVEEDSLAYRGQPLFRLRRQSLRLIYVNQQRSGDYWGLNPASSSTCPLKPGAFERLVANGTLRLMEGETGQYEGEIDPEGIDGCFGTLYVLLDNLLDL
jgi:hypothetical protein